LTRMSSPECSAQTYNCKSRLPQDKICQRLSGLSLVLSREDEALICSRCMYALQPFGQTVSKHLWEKHSIPAKDSSGLNALVIELKLPDPNTLPRHQDWSQAHPHLAVQSGAVCLQCNYRSTSADLLQRHLSKEHGQRRADMDIQRGNVWREVGLQIWSQDGKREFWIVESNVDQATTLPIEGKGFRSNPNLT
jgi:hypothetical protein